MIQKAVKSYINKYEKKIQRKNSNYDINFRHLSPNRTLGLPDAASIPSIRFTAKMPKYKKLSENVLLNGSWLEEKSHLSDEIEDSPNMRDSKGTFMYIFLL